MYNFFIKLKKLKIKQHIYYKTIYITNKNDNMEYI